MRVIYSDLSPVQAITEADTQTNESIMEALASMYGDEDDEDAEDDEDEFDDEDESDDEDLDDEDNHPPHMNGGSPYSLN